MENRFIFSGVSPVTLTDADLLGGISYQQNINPTTDMQLGICAMGELKFTIRDVNNISANLLGRAFTWQNKQMYEPALKTMGIFWVKDIKKNRTQAEITAYDGMCKFDVFVDDWLAGLTFPITLANMLTSLCAYCGVTLGTSTASITNFNYSIPKTFAASNITGRTVLSYICEVAGAFAVFESDGTLRIKYYSARAVNLTNADYISLWTADYYVPDIDKLQIRSTETDIGVIVGTGTNIYVIENNPLLYADTPSQIQTQATNIYNRIRVLGLYKPASITLFRDMGINCGDIITVSGNMTVIMEKRITAGGVTLESTGNPKREEQSDKANQTIKRLHGSIASMKLELGQFEVRLESVENSEGIDEIAVKAIISAEITDTGGSIRQYVEGKNYITKTDADGTYLKITNLNAGISTYINEPAGKAEIVSAAAGTYQRIDQMGNYVATANLNTSIGQYIDSTAGSAKVVSAATGTFQKITDMSNYATLTVTNSITQTVNKHTSEIALVVQNGSLSGSLIVAAINGQTTANINFDRINLTGKTINLTSNNLIISSTNFNVDRYGNVTANNGTFTGVINATGGNIGGKLTFNNNANIYINGTPGFLDPSIIKVGPSTDYFAVYYDSTVYGINMYANNSHINNLQTLGIIFRQQYQGAQYGRIEYLSNSMVLRAGAGTGIIFVVETGNTFTFQRGGFLGSNYNVWFDPGATAI